MKEKVTIYFDDLFSNLIITLRENGINEDKIPYSLIDQYGTILRDNLNKRNIQINFAVNNDNIDNFLIRNKEYYKDSETDGSIMILKKKDIVQMVLEHQSCLPASILRSIFNQDVITQTLEAYIDELVSSQEKENAKTKVKKINSKKGK